MLSTLLKIGYCEETLADKSKITIVYFVEDIAHEGIIKALVEKVAREKSIDVKNLTHDFRSSRGGSKFIKAFESFLEDVEKAGFSDADFLVVVKDGNCKGYTECIKRLQKKIKEGHPLRDRVVYAVPNPHIERWYVMDQRAFKKGVGLGKAPNLPPYKCEKDYYKRVIRQALESANIKSLLGGVEFAERIVDEVQDLELLFRDAPDLGRFVDELRRMFVSLKLV